MINNHMQTKDSPYSTGFLSANINYDLDTLEQFKSLKKEEDNTHPAGSFLPYELSALPQYCGDIVNNAMDASIKIDTVLNNRNLKNPKPLIKLKKNLDAIIRYMVKNVDSTLDNYAIDANFRSNDEIS
jgi:hypothetical protein